MRSVASDERNAAFFYEIGNILSEQMLYKTADGCKTAVPRNSGVPASRLDMLQEREHGVGTAKALRRS
jgi:hypothetical protein